MITQGWNVTNARPSCVILQETTSFIPNHVTGIEGSSENKIRLGGAVFHFQKIFRIRDPKMERMQQLCMYHSAILWFFSHLFFCDVSSLISEYVETFVVFMFQSLWIFLWYTYLNEQIAGQFPTSFFQAIVISEAAEAKPFPTLTNTFSNRLKQPTI